MKTVASPLGSGSVSRSGSVKCPPLIRLVAGMWIQKNPYRRDGRNRSLKGDSIKKGAVRFRTHLYCCCLKSSLPKPTTWCSLSTLLTAHRERGEKRAVSFPEFH